MTQPRTEPVSFRVLRGFNDPALRPVAGTRARVDARVAQGLPADSLVRAVVEALARDGLLPLKEVCESFEFFERTRKKVRSPSMADLAAGHGLTGLLFGIFERSVERITLVDTRPSPSAERILQALCGPAPWLGPKVQWITGRIEDTTLEPGTAVLAVHACGTRTDRCVDVALQTGGPVALMPCCYPKKGEGSPALYQALGEQLAADIHRTLRLEAAGYRVSWTRIPEVITPMNRVLVGRLWRSPPR